MQYETYAYRWDHTRSTESTPEFCELSADAATQAFLNNATKRGHSPWTQWVYQLMRRWMSDFDAHGHLGIYPMHLLSQAQWTQLLAGLHIPRGHLIDVGCGQGFVSAPLASQFETTYGVETSGALAKRYRTQIGPCIEFDLCRAPWIDAQQMLPEVLPSQPNAFACLNVLDRCARPRTLLRHLHDALAPDGWLLIALALPLCPVVYEGAQTKAPAETLPTNTGQFEFDVQAIIETLLLPMGFRVERISRAPYLSIGVQGRIDSLDDAIFICRKTDFPTEGRKPNRIQSGG